MFLCLASNLHSLKVFEIHVHVINIYPQLKDIKPILLSSAKAAYRPPGARGQPAAEKLHTYELPSNMKQQAAAAGKHYEAVTV